MIYSLRDKSGFLSLLGLIFTLAIICYVLYMMLRIYFKPLTLDKPINKTLSEQSINTLNYQTIQDTTRKKIDAISKQHLKELDELQK